MKTNKSTAVGENYVCNGDVNWTFYGSGTFCRCVDVLGNEATEKYIHWVWSTQYNLWFSLYATLKQKQRLSFFNRQRCPKVLCVASITIIYERTQCDQNLLPSNTLLHIASQTRNEIFLIESNKWMQCILINADKWGLI